MKRKTIRLIIVLATLLLIGLVVTQIFWVGKAYDLQERQFDHDVTAALKNVTRQILQHSDDPSSIIDPVEQVDFNYFRVSINDTLHPYYLQVLLTNEFLKQEINTDFEYSIYDCFNDSVVYSNYVSLEKDSSNVQEASSPPVDWANDGHYFAVFFPEKQSFLLSRLGFWFTSSAILLIVAIFFAYVIYVILKQKRLSEIKTDFINNMTHELKTPISTISLSSEVLMKPGIEKDPQRLLNYARIIYTENNRLKNQVERVLQIATLDHEKIKLNKIKINVHDIIKSSARSIEINLQDKKGELTMELLAKDPVLLADEVHLTNIIHNLLDNASKYSPESPRITISSVNENDLLKISVEDNGIGIRQEYLKQVFDKFFRVPTGNVHDVKGFGLGLNYVKVMVEAHGGRVEVNSEPGAGSRFDIYLPSNKA